jgi:transposase
VIRRLNRLELTDAHWQVIKPLVPRPHHIGRPPRDAREMLEAMLWLLRVGAPWRDLPDGFGPWQTVYTRFCHWRDDGTLDRIIKRLQVLLGDAGKLDWELWCIDGTSVRAARCASGARKKGARQIPQTTRWGAPAAV